MVPTEKRSQLSDDIFGMKPAQIRKLRPDSVDDVALCATRQLIYMGIVLRPSVVPVRDLTPRHQ